MPSIWCLIGLSVSTNFKLRISACKNCSSLLKLLKIRAKWTFSTFIIKVSLTPSGNIFQCTTTQNQGIVDKDVWDSPKIFPLMKRSLYCSHVQLEGKRCLQWHRILQKTESWKSFILYTDDILNLIFWRFVNFSSNMFNILRQLLETIFNLSAIQVLSQGEIHHHQPCIISKEETY